MTEPSTSEQTECHKRHITFHKQMQDLRQYEWYWGNISSSRAEKLLTDQPPGTFLIRDSRSDKYLFALSYITEEDLCHTRVSNYNGRYCLGGPNAIISADSLAEFVQKTVTSSVRQDQYSILEHPSTVDGRSHPIKLLYPLNRRSFNPPLKYLCRLVIRKMMEDEGKISELPIPPSLKRYLRASNYLYPF